MSFTVKVKEELLGLDIKSKNELAAIMKMSGNLGISAQGLTLSITTENAKIARHIYELLLTFYEVKSDIRHHQKTNLRKNRVYTVFLDEKVENILSVFMASELKYDDYKNLENISNIRNIN